MWVRFFEAVGAIPFQRKVAEPLPPFQEVPRFAISARLWFEKNDVAGLPPHHDVYELKRDKLTNAPAYFKVCQ